MNVHDSADLQHLKERIASLTPEAGEAPDLSVVVPVNAQGDLRNVLRLAQDVFEYNGAARFEMILVVNNFDENEPPSEIEEFRGLGFRVIGIPDVRRPGEAVGFSARIPGVRAAESEFVVLFDADCRVPQPTALLDWYLKAFRDGAQAAYTPVSYYGLPEAPSIRFRFAIHHTSRWIKRNVLRIPTTRGSNYGVRRTPMLELYEAGLLADEMNVGPTFKKLRGRVAYSGKRRLTVYTSGRMFHAGWRRIFPYFYYRLRYNLRVLRVREGVADVTGRENDPVRRYVDNQPVKDD